jgi:hypothetical protein
LNCEFYSPPMQAGSLSERCLEAPSAAVLKPARSLPAA